MEELSINQRTIIIILLIAILLALSFIYIDGKFNIIKNKSIISQTSKTIISQIRYEYIADFSTDDSLESMMEKYGNDSWELIFARRATDSNEKWGYECIFKRIKK
jgi:hypothetical protein